MSANSGRELVSASFWSLAIKIAATGCNFGLAILLARSLEVSGFGQYSLLMSIVTLLTVPGMVGGRQVLIREVSAYSAKSEYSKLRGISRFFLCSGLGFSLLLGALLVLAGTTVFSDRLSNTSRWLIVLPAAIVPLIVLTNLLEAILRGLHKVVVGQMSIVLRPLFVLILVFLLTRVWRVEIDVSQVLSLQLLALVLLLVIQFTLMKHFTPGEVKRAPPQYDYKVWLLSAMPLMLTGGVQILSSQSAVLMLGALQDSEAVAVYRVAERCSELVTFALLAINMAIAPRIARLFALNEKEKLQRVIVKSTIPVVLLGGIIMVTLLFAGNYLIVLFFGERYAGAYDVMVLLAIGQFFSAFMGPIGTLVNMCGLERFGARAVLITTAGGVACHLILIPLYGATGAAIASAASLIALNLLLAYWLYRETGLSVGLSIFKRFVSQKR